METLCGAEIDDVQNNIGSKLNLSDGLLPAPSPQPERPPNAMKFSITML